MKILFILPRMVAGGVERVTLNLIAQFICDGIECRIAIRHCQGELLQEARSLVPVTELAPRSLYQFVPNLAKLIRAWQPTHVVTAFADIGVLTWTAICLTKSATKWIHGVHNTHEAIAAHPGLTGRVRHLRDNRLAGFVYRRADKIVAVSEGVRNEIIKLFAISPSQVVTIYNPVIRDDQLQPRPEITNVSWPYRIVAIGRLVRQKGFDVLIEALKQVRRPWELDIYGEGPERARLESLIADANLRAVVRLHGYTSEPFVALRHADLFVLPSRYEGLPTVLIEALACQCQIVSTDCPQGPREILQAGRLGQLIPPDDSLALARAIELVVGGEHRVNPDFLIERARAFSVAGSTRLWKRLLLT